MRLFNIQFKFKSREEARAGYQPAGETEATHWVTLNPEMALAAADDPALASILAGTPCVVADGVGLQWVAALTGQHVPDRVSGIDLVETWSRNANRVYFLGASPASNMGAIAWCKKVNPTADVAGTAVIFVDTLGESADTGAVVAQIRQHRPEVLFVALGHGKQEKWIHHTLSQIPGPCAVIGVGGSFDILSGAVRRAPCWMQRVGVEWLWRLFMEPQRFARIWNAVVVFPVRAIQSHLVSKR